MLVFEVVIMASKFDVTVPKIQDNNMVLLCIYYMINNYINLSLHELIENVRKFLEMNLQHFSEKRNHLHLDMEQENMCEIRRKGNQDQLICITYGRM